MNHKPFKTMLATVLCLGALAAPALAQIGISIDIGEAPPPPRYEVIEEVRPGYVLIPGYWFWDGHKHRWVEHRWEQARPGHHWVPDRWERRGEYHHFEPGRWERDRAENVPEGYGGHGAGGQGQGRPGQYENSRDDYGGGHSGGHHM